MRLRKSPAETAEVRSTEGRHRATRRGRVSRPQARRPVGAEPGHKPSSGRFVPGEEPGHWLGAACKAERSDWGDQYLYVSAL